MKNVLILGAGVVGVASAYYLAKKGCNVKVLDAAAAPGSQTSFANGSQLSYSKTHPLADIEILKRLPKLVFDKNTPIHIHPRLDFSFMRWSALFLRECIPARSRINAEAVLNLALKSRNEMHKIVAEHEINFDYAKRGKLYVFTNEREFKVTAKDVDAHKHLGITQRLLTPAAAVQLEPALADMQVLMKGAIFSDIDESGDAQKFTAELAKICTGMGVVFEYNAKVDNFRVAGGKVAAALSNGREFAADEIVVCLGPESPRVLKRTGDLFADLPDEGLQHHHPGR